MKKPSQKRGFFAEFGIRNAEFGMKNIASWRIETVLTKRSRILPTEALGRSWQAGRP